jgi:hypothetical protein
LKEKEEDSLQYCVLLAPFNFIRGSELSIQILMMLVEKAADLN